MFEYFLFFSISLKLLRFMFADVPHSQSGLLA
jgi:hypothetical protein